ncbi:MAG: beta-ketoacyl-ACP synthase II [Desulforegulaceae bacterium]|nr:beta-ketoacyl-ACP synthase II [Desulforegulaceae bacterium]
MNEAPFHRVAVTGIGVVSPVGTGKKEFFDSLAAGKSGIDFIKRFNTDGFTFKVAGEVKNFIREDYFKKNKSNNLPLYILYAVAAGKLAVLDSGLDLDYYGKNKIGIFGGNGAGGFDLAEEAVERHLLKKTSRLSPYFIPHFLPNMAVGTMSIHLGIKGPVLTCASACAAGANAIGEAYLRIKYGEMDCCIAGGTEAVITPVFLSGLNSMKALSKNTDPESASRPFDKKRDGFVPGEGSAFLVLENMDKALKRGAKPLAEITGYSVLSEGYHIAAPEPEGKGMADVMEAALLSSGLNPCEIDYINAHGTSTILNDKYETAAIKKVFKDNYKNLKLSSTKSMTGHLLGAAGALEAAACVLSLENQLIFPTINLNNPDPDCFLDYVPNKSQKAKLNYVMSNSFGFGGVNTCLVFKKSS